MTRLLLLLLLFLMTPGLSTMALLFTLPDKR